MSPITAIKPNIQFDNVTESSRRHELNEQIQTLPKVQSIEIPSFVFSRASRCYSL